MAACRHRDGLRPFRPRSPGRNTGSSKQPTAPINASRACAVWCFSWLICLGIACTALAQEQPARERKAGALPWEVRPRTREPVLRPPSRPAELLERFEIGASQLESFFSGQALTPAEEDVLVKILFRLPRLGLENLQRWRRDDVTWDQLAAAPRDFRTEVFRVTGRVQRVEKHDLLPEQAMLYEFEHYYRVTLAIEDSPYRAVLLARRVPSAWPLDEPIDQPAAADGLFLKLGDSSAESPPLIFAAGRVGWYPERPQADHGIGEPQLALSKLGFDAGLWQDVREANATPLGATDREAFYQLLAALSRPEARALQGTGPEPLDVVALLQRPEEHMGQVLRLRGTARRIMKVPVRDVDVRARFGIDHYYEIDLSAPLGEKSLRFGNDPTGEQNPVYHNNFPVTLIARRLPPGLEEGENLRDTLRAEAVFYRIWSYRSNYADKFGQMQPAPLLMTVEPALYESPPAANWVAAALVGAAFTLALGVIAIIAFWYRGSDRPVRRQELPIDQKPDFSGLD
jgi:hypothetical protein